MHHGHVIALGSVQELRSLFQTYDGCELQVRHLSEVILTQLKLIEGVHDCSITNQNNGLSGLELRISNRSTVLPQVLQLMVQSGVEVCDCQIKELPLDEIFAQALQRNNIGRIN